MGITRRYIPVLIFFLSICLPLSLPASKDLPVEAVEQALTGSDLTRLFSLVDVQALAQRAGLDQSAVDALKQIQSRLGNQRFNSYRLYTTDDGHLRLRLDLAPRGLTWLTLYWQDPNAEQPLVDWYDQALGISLSELVAGMVMLAEDRAGRRFLQQLDRNPRIAWEKLPDNHRKNSAAARLLLAACGTSPCYSLALDAMSAQPQEIPALWQLDQAAAADDRPRYQRILEQLNETLGPDPGLVWLAGAEALRYHDCEAIMATVKTALSEWPDYQPLYPVLTQCLVMGGHFDLALAFFAIMEDRFAMALDWSALARHPVYKKLLSSPEYSRWQKQRKQQREHSQQKD